MICRAVVADEVPVLRELLQALSDHDGGGQVASVENLVAQGFGARVLYWAVMAWDGDQALGMVIYFPEYSTHSGRTGVYVQDLFVADAARGIGVGRGLLAAAMQVQDWGAAFMTLGISPGNAGGRAFYARQGFRARGYEMMIIDGAALEALR